MPVHPFTPSLYYARLPLFNMATDLCLPLLKYSHAIGMSTDNTIPWIHLQASDLFVIVTGKNTHIVDGLLTLRVVEGNRVLVRLAKALELPLCHKTNTDAGEHRHRAVR